MGLFGIGKLFSGAEQMPPVEKKIEEQTMGDRIQEILSSDPEKLGGREFYQYKVLKFLTEKEAEIISFESSNNPGRSFVHVKFKLQNETGLIEINHTTEKILANYKDNTLDGYFKSNNLQEKLEQLIS